MVQSHFPCQLVAALRTSVEWKGPPLVCSMAARTPWIYPRKMEEFAITNILHYCVHIFPQVKSLIKLHLDFLLLKAQVRKYKPENHLLLLLKSSHCPEVPLRGLTAFCTARGLLSCFLSDTEDEEHYTKPAHWPTEKL